MTTTRRELAPRYDAAAVEPGDLRALAGERRLLAGGGAAAGRGAVRHHPAAAERHRRPAPRPCADGDGRGPADPLPPHARRRHALGAGRRPRQHRRAVRPRPDHRRGGGDPRLAGSRALPRADVAVHGRDARRHRASSTVAWAPASTGRAPLHDGRRQRAGRAGRLQAAVGRRPRLPRRGARQLVPALPHHDQRPREHQARGDRDAVEHSLPPRPRGRNPRPRGVDHGGHHPPRDDLRRHGGGGASRGRSLPGAGRPRGDPAVPRPAPADHRRRARRARVRHRGGEDHARA